MSERRLDSLTSLRFFACLLVVLYHYGHVTAHVPVLSDLVRSGHLGVGFFFVLSGFILVTVYASRLRDRPLDRRKFYVARVARTYPVYFVAILLSAASWAADLGSAKGPTIGRLTLALFLRLTLLSAWVPGYALQLNVPAWTLSVEAFFYAVFPFVLVAALRMRSHVRRVGIAMVAMAGVLTTVGLHRIDPSNAP